MFNHPVSYSTLRKDSIITLPERYLTQVKRKSDHVEAQVDKRTAQALDRFAKQEKNLSLWQGSALLGVSEKYKINAKMKGNLMVLYDFLASRSVPATSAIKVRIGYTL
ncbi:hypothetical protein [Chitinophaga sp.]|uniref:hypothetical protein n=1 Tax=Chitinophaga sp. TaxID=1869181 RepID=UPI0031DFADA0